MFSSTIQKIRARFGGAEENSDNDSRLEFRPSEPRRRFLDWYKL